MFAVLVSTNIYWLINTNAAYYRGAVSIYGCYWVYNLCPLLGANEWSTVLLLQTYSRASYKHLIRIPAQSAINVSVLSQHRQPGVVCFEKSNILIFMAKVPRLQYNKQLKNRALISQCRKKKTSSRLTCYQSTPRASQTPCPNTTL